MLLTAAASALWGQTADRADPAPPKSDGVAVKALRLFEPFEPKPFTAKERLHLYIVSTVGPLSILTQAASAGIFQALNRPPEWGQGAKGYGKRMADGFAYNAVRTTITLSSGRLADG